MAIAFSIIAFVSGVALILSVMFQTTKAEGFSAAMGGGGSGADSRFKPGSREEWLYKITKVSAVIWIISCVLVAFTWYQTH